LTVTNSTFSGNTGSTPSFQGGAIDNGGLTLAVTNSTFSDNTGGGIVNEVGSARVTSSTFFNNTGGGVVERFGLVRVKATILAANSGGNCANAGATITDAGYNISDDSSCGFSKTGSANNGDNVDPLLSSAGLAANGGPTLTVALQLGSPAIDAIPVAVCTDQDSPPNPITTDQRGLPRPDANEQVCDIGAYEFQDAPEFAGHPGKANCHGKSVSALDHEFGSLDAAASALGFSSVKALQSAIKAFCTG
jgi:hypothetical protein